MSSQYRRATQPNQLIQENRDHLTTWAVEDWRVRSTSAQAELEDMREAIRRRLARSVLTPARGAKGLFNRRLGQATIGP